MSGDDDNLSPPVRRVKGGRCISRASFVQVSSATHSTQTGGRVTQENEGARNRLRVVVNAAAGGHSGAGAVERIRAALDAAGVVADVEAVPPPLEESLRAQVRAGAPMAGIGGGDGSVRAAADVVAGSSTALAVFPTGTLNHFSRRLGIATLEQAAGAVVAGRCAPIATGSVDGRLFLNTATFGLYADVLRRRERLRRWLGKWPGALVAFFATIARYRPVRVTIEVDGILLERTTALVWVGLGYGSFPVVPRATERRRAPDLEIATLHAHSRSGLIALGARTAVRILRGERPLNDAGVEIMHTRGFTLHSSHGHLGVTLDGEIMPFAAPLEVRVIDDALRVVVPGDGPAATGPESDVDAAPHAERRAREA